MTAQILPFANLKDLDPAMLQAMLKEMATLQAEQRREQRKQNNWRNAAKPNQSQNGGMDPMIGMMLASVLFGGFFDMPMMQGLGDMSQSMNGLSQIGLMNMVEGGTDNNGITSDVAGMTASLAMLNSGNKNQSDGMNLMDIVLVLALLKYLSNGHEEKEGSGGDEMLGLNSLRNMKKPCPSEMVASDSLRNFRMARFKQNRRAFYKVEDAFRNNGIGTPHHKAAKLAL